MGADVNAMDNKGRTALMEALTSNKIDCLHFLISKGADINKQDNEGCTPLMRACFSGFPEMCLFLLDRGANKDLKDMQGRRAIDYYQGEIPADLKQRLS